MKFNSHRSTLTCLHGCTASTQTIASQIGIDILKQKGNAADAAVAVAAALNVMEPCSTGIGGDAFCLFYSKKEKKVLGLNASGRAPENLSLKYLNSLSFENNRLPPTHALTVTVPGACSGWVDCVNNFGSGNLSLKEILNPAIELARNGFPVSGPITSNSWLKCSGPLLKEQNLHGKELLVKDKVTDTYRAPCMGEVFRNPGLANVFEEVATKGKDGFYKGWVAQSIVDVLQKHDGVMTCKDLEEHTSTLVEPISIDYKGVKLWEIPPNGQGIVALEALNILKNFNVDKLNHNSIEYLHLLVESMKLSFADGLQYCSDISQSHAPVHELLDEDYGKQRAALIDQNKAAAFFLPGDPPKSQGDTVYFTTADEDGNFCSFINSNYMAFGTGLVPQGCGFSLQNRGYNFSLKEGHPNVVAPRKRPYHTIIPAMLTDSITGELLMSYGVMGGFMQPQGHVQVLMNMLEFGMDPQEALDAPRFLLGSGHLSPLGTVNLEEGIDETVCQGLTELGHNLNAHVSGFDRAMFGRGQIAARKNFWNKSGTNTSVLWVGSDPRGDGVAVGY